jgi:hypothetical protein
MFLPGTPGLVAVRGNGLMRELVPECGAHNDERDQLLLRLST